MATQIEEIISLKSVNVYHINYNKSDNSYDLISVISDSQFRIFREVITNTDTHNDKQTLLSNRLAIIKCKDWFYPLESSVTQVYRCSDVWRCYLFPNNSSPDSLSFVIINDTEDDAKVLLLENVLLMYASLQQSPQNWSAIINEIVGSSHLFDANTDANTRQQFIEEVTDETHDSSTAEALAQNLVNGCHVINTGITRGTELASGLIIRGTTYIKANQEPNQTPTTVDPRVVTGLRTLRTASQTACSVTGACVSVVAKGTHHFGQWVAPHVKKHGSNLIGSVSGKNERESGRMMDNILTVANGGLQGFATLYHGVTENAKMLAKTVSDETVDIVNRRYGNEAGTATEDLLHSAGNAALTVQNVQHLGPKAIAKKAALDTGKTVITSKTKEDESQRKF